MRDQPRYDYRSLGLSDEHIPELARLSVDPALFWADPGFEPYFDDGPPLPGALTPAQIKQREAEARRKAKNKRKMVQQSRKQNRKKK